MLIRDIEYIPLRIKKKGVGGREWTTALGTTPYGDGALVLLRADNGEAGIGEVSSIWDSCADGLIAGVGQKIREAVVGVGVFSITEALDRMDRAVRWNKNANCLKAGVEMAMYDLMGRSTNLPVYALLGGKRRDRVALSRSIAMGTTAERLTQVAEQVAAGFRTVKVKVGAEYASDLAAVRAIRERFGPELGIRVDANMGWRDEKALLRLADALCALDVLSIEQPFGPRDLQQLAFVRARSPIPIMLDESVWDLSDAVLALKADAGDIYNIYVSEAGGLSRAMQIAHLCDAAGVGFCIGSMPEFGVGTAAALHLAMAAPRIDHPSDVIGNLYFEDDIICETLPVQDGLALSVDRPGLGITLDWDKIEKYRTDR
jgi:L-alanine-DL-glutamate epimerase-like enolase superfamily enzyme